MLATLLVDFVWLLYWGITWGSDEYQKSGATGTSSFVMALSIIAFILKVPPGTPSW